MVSRVEYVRTLDVRRSGVRMASVLRSWLNQQPGAATLVARSAAHRDELLSAVDLPATVNIAIGPHRLKIAGPLLLLAPDEATLDVIDRHLTATSPVLVMLHDERPTTTGWLRRYRAVQTMDRSVLAPLDGVLGEPAVEYGLRYLLGQPVRGFGHDAYRREPARSKAISAFAAFHRGGLPVEPGPLLLEFLVSNGATINDAKVLDEYARRIICDAGLPTPSGNGFREGILEVWRAATERPTT